MPISNVFSGGRRCWVQSENILVCPERVLKQNSCQTKHQMLEPTYSVSKDIPVETLNKPL